MEKDTKQELSIKIAAAIIFVIILALGCRCASLTQANQRAAKTNEVLNEDVLFCIDTFKDIKLHNSEEWDRLNKVDKFQEFVDSYSYYFEE
jgi:hypothetical protein